MTARSENKIIPNNLLECLYRRTACHQGSYVNRIPARVLKMAPHGQETTPDVKEIILKLSCEGYIHKKISEVTGKNRRTISKIIQRSRSQGNEENTSRRGGIKKTSDRSDRDLFRMVRKNRRQTLKDATSRFNESYEQDLSARSVRRRLFEEGYKRRRVSKATTVSKVK